MKDVLIHASIDFLMKTLLTTLSCADVNQMVTRAERYRCSGEAKRRYVLDHVSAIEHQSDSYTHRLVTEMAIYQYKTRTTRK